MNIDERVGGVFLRRHKSVMMAQHQHVVSLSGPELVPATIPELDQEIGTILDAADRLLGPSTTEPDTPILLHTQASLLIHLDDYLTVRGLTRTKFDWSQRLFQRYQDHGVPPPHPLYNLIGRALSERDEDAAAIEFFLQALDTCNLPDDDLDKARLWANLAVSLWGVGNLDAALLYLHRAERIIQEKGTNREWVLALSNRSQMLLDAGDATGALLTGFEALKIAQAVDDLRLQGQIVSLNAKHMMVNGLHEQALPVFQQALHIQFEADDQPGLAVTTLNYALLLHLTGKDDRAQVFAESSLQLAQAYDLKAEAQQAADLLATLSGGAAAPPTVPPEAH